MSRLQDLIMDADEVQHEIKQLKFDIESQQKTLEALEKELAELREEFESLGGYDAYERELQ